MNLKSRIESKEQEMHSLASSLSELQQSLTQLKAKKMSTMPVRDQYESLVQLNSKLSTLSK